MKKSIFLTSLVFAFIAEITMLVIFTVQKTENWQDAVVVNEIVQAKIILWLIIMGRFCTVQGKGLAEA